MPVPPPPLTPPKPTNLSPQDIGARLQKLYTTPAVSQYGPFFFLHQIKRSDWVGAAGFAIDSSDQDLLVQTYYQWGYPNVQLYLHGISALAANAPKVFSGKDQLCQAFISLDKINYSAVSAKVLVPYETAALLSASFIQGLITRLLLNRYRQTWGSIGINLWTDLPLVPAPPVGPLPDNHPHGVNGK